MREEEGFSDDAAAAGWGAPNHLDHDGRARRIPAQRLFDIAKMPLDVTGTVDGTVRLTGTFNDPRADGAVTLTDGFIGGQPVDRAIAAVRWAGGGRQLEDGSLEGDAVRRALPG